MSNNYNYKRFKPEFYDLEHFEGPRAGQSFPDLILEDCEGKRFAIADLKGKWVVIESGSITCPQYVDNIAKMHNLAQLYPDVVFLMLYVREAHPGNKIQPPASFQEKCSRAQLTKEYQEFRTVLIDDLEGRYHQKLGSRPNFVYILNPELKIVFRSDWNVPGQIGKILKEQNPQKIHEKDHFEPHLAPPLLTLRVIMKAGVLALIDIILGAPQLLKMHLKAKKITQFPILF